MKHLLLFIQSFLLFTYNKEIITYEVIHDKILQKLKLSYLNKIMKGD